MTKEREIIHQRYRFHARPSPVNFSTTYPLQGGGSTCPRHEEPRCATNTPGRGQTPVVFMAAPFHHGFYTPHLSPMDDIWPAASQRLGVSRPLLPISPARASPCSSELLIVVGRVWRRKKERNGQKSERELKGEREHRDGLMSWSRQGRPLAIVGDGEGGCRLLGWEEEKAWHGRKKIFLANEELSFPQFWLATFILFFFSRMGVLPFLPSILNGKTPI